MIFQISYKEIKGKARNLPYEITIIISTEVYYVTRDCTGMSQNGGLNFEKLHDDGWFWICNHICSFETLLTDTIWAPTRFS